MIDCLMLHIQSKTVPIKIKNNYLKGVGDNEYKFFIPLSSNDNELIEILHFLENCKILDNNCYLVIENNVKYLKNLLVLFERYAHVLYGMTSVRLKYNEHIKNKKDFLKVHKYDLKQLGDYLLELPLSELISVKGKELVIAIGDYERLIISFKIYKNFVKKLIKPLTQQKLNDIISYERLLDEIDYYNTFSKKIIKNYPTDDYMIELLNFNSNNVKCCYKYSKR